MKKKKRNLKRGNKSKGKVAKKMLSYWIEFNPVYL